MGEGLKNPGSGMETTIGDRAVTTYPYRVGGYKNAKSRWNRTEGQRAGNGPRKGELWSRRIQAEHVNENETPEHRN
jgi:hypothetical protein